MTVAKEVHVKSILTVSSCPFRESIAQERANTKAEKRNDAAEARRQARTRAAEARKAHLAEEADEQDEEPRAALEYEEEELDEPSLEMLEAE